MEIRELLPPKNVVIDLNEDSKKRVLERISRLIVEDITAEITASAVLHSLVSRERLGSTVIGNGVALPHGRLAGISHAKGALLRLKKPILFDDEEHGPIDILFGVIVPEEATEEHLQILSKLATIFHHKELCKKIRAATNGDEIYKLITNAKQS